MFEPRLAPRPAWSRTPTVPSTSISVRRHRPARRPTGCRPTPTAGSRFSFACMGPRSRSSTRPGYCRTSSRRQWRRRAMSTNLYMSRFAHTRRNRRRQPAGDAVPVTADNFIRAESDMLSRLVEQGGFGKFYHFRELTPIDNHTSARQPRHALFHRCVRPRCRAGDDHATGRGQALHDDDRDRRGPLRLHGRLWRRPSDPHARRGWHALRLGGDPHPGRSQ